MALPTAVADMGFWPVKIRPCKLIRSAVDALFRLLTGGIHIAVYVARPVSAGDKCGAAG